MRLLGLLLSTYKEVSFELLKGNIPEFELDTEQIWKIEVLPICKFLFLLFAQLQNMYTLSIIVSPTNRDTFEEIPWSLCH